MVPTKSLLLFLLLFVAHGLSSKTNCCPSPYDVELLKALNKLPKQLICVLSFIFVCILSMAVY